MTTETGRPGPDEETIAFAGRVFHMARTGLAADLVPLLDAGLPANLINDKGDSLLMLAAYHGHLDVVRALLAHGADPAIANDRGQVPIAAAVFKGETAVVAALVDGGAAVDGAGPDGRTGLMVAAMFGRLDLVEMLLAQGADPAARDAGGLTAGDFAERMGAAEVAARLATTASAGDRGREPCRST